MVRADDTNPPEPKSEDTAFWLSAGGSLVSLGMMGLGGLVFELTLDTCSGYNCPPQNHQGLHSAATGLGEIGVAASMFTPAIGKWYAGSYVTGGMGLRLAGLLMVAIGSYQGCTCGIGAPTHPPDTAMEGLGVAVYAGGMLYDVLTARRDVRRYNAEHGLQAKLVPSIAMQASARTYGLGVVGSF